VVQEGPASDTSVPALKNLHNHAACQFPAEHKWKAVEKHLREVHGIKVHVSKHSCYRTMYDYITTATTKKPESEIDKDFYISPGHPPVEQLPLPERSLMAAWSARSATSRDRKTDESMKIIEFYDLVRALPQPARTADALWARATEQQESGDRRLITFMLGRRDLPQVLERIAKAEEAPEKARRAQKSRGEILQDTAAFGTCSCTESERWHKAMDEVLHLNGYNDQQLETAILEALLLGRAKQRNIFIVGNTNRAKSFCFKPMALVYATFKPPDTGSHQLADLKGSEVVWLNEFEYDPAFLSWRKLKDFLEGEPVKVAVPKTQGANYTFDDDAPVFGTAPGPIEHPKQPAETEQMMSRVRYFVFEHFFDPGTCPDIKPCARCWARWILAARGRPRGPPGPPPANLNAFFAKNRATQNAPARQTWFLQKPAGTYQPQDCPGCFKCGDPGHSVADCPVSSQNAPVASLAPNFCGGCGAARQGAGGTFCTHCGQPFA